jgi:hydrophobic/amphiphilic exporter-1 (mainly G- bacteria), HAE1 family
MKIDVSTWSIRNPVPSIVLFVVLCLLGITSFMKLPITRFPNIDIPIVAVTITQSGAAPVELETQITKRVEDAVSAITGVKNIISTMSDGASTTVVEFQIEVDTQRAVDDVKDAVDRIRADLPASIDQPQVQRIDVEGAAIQTFAVSSPGMTLEQLSWFVDDTVIRELQTQRGVGRVTRYGGVSREIRIDLDPQKLAAQRVTAADVNRQIRSTNADLGGGRGEVGGREQAIRTLGGARSVEELSAIKIALPGGRQVALSDLGSISDSNEEPRVTARFDDNPVVTFGIFRAKGASDVVVGEAVAKRLETLKAANPEVAFSLVDDSVRYTHGNYTAAMATLIEGSLLAVLVVLIFLRNLRATLIAAIALPLSAIPTFWVMDQLGFSLNLVSFLGITLATGILVDDAIVEIENIARHMRMGKSPYRASMEAAAEIGMAVIAISLVIIAVFVPVSFMSGIAGQYFRQFGITVAVAVAFSLLVARLITPMMAAYLMKPIPHREHKDGLFTKGYLGLLHLLNWGPKIHRQGKMTIDGRLPGKVYRPRVMSYVTMAGSFSILYASTLLLPYLPTGFIPPGDESRFVLSVELPPGSTLEQTTAVTSEMSERIRQNEHVKSVFALNGSSAQGNREVRLASLFVQLDVKSTDLVPGMINPIIERVGFLKDTFGLLPATGRVTPQSVVENAIFPNLADIPDIRWYKVNERGDREVAFNMRSNDPEALALASARLEAAMRKETIVRNVSAKGALDRPEIKILPKFEEAARLGITPEQISETVRVATIGDAGAALAKFNAGDRLIPIRVQVNEDARKDIREISALRVPNAAGESVPLAAVADISFSQGPSTIERYNRMRNAQFGADLTPGTQLGDASAKFEAVAKSLNFPASVNFGTTGDAEIQGEVQQGFAFAGMLGLVMMLGILVLLMGSIFQPFAILLSLPLSLGGVILALLMTNNALSMPVFIGLLMLMGIVAKNGIMLVEFAIEEVKQGVDRVEAIIDAGRKRARPIVMTTIAMGAGMLPSAYGIGEGGEFRSPMAIAVIGGLIGSTFLSLIFVPSFYVVMDDLTRFTSWMLGRFIGPKDEPEHHEMKPEEMASVLSKANQLIEKLTPKAANDPGPMKPAMAAE